MRRDGLHVTTPDVTIVHLARVLADLPYERTVQETFAKRLTSARQLAERSSATAAAGPPGSADARARRRRPAPQGGALAPPLDQRANLHPLSFNAEVGPWRVDALCGTLAVEVNGYAAHGSPWAHDRDHRKEQWLLGHRLRRAPLHRPAGDRRAGARDRPDRRGALEAVFLRPAGAGVPEAAALGVPEAAAVAERALPPCGSLTIAVALKRPLPILFGLAVATRGAVLAFFGPM